MKARILLIFTFVFVFLFTLAFAVCAEEYTVFSSEEFKAAFDSAVDGDTIVIKADITGELEFGKSITYIIDGNYTWLAGGRANDTGKTVSVYARNGNGVFMPNAAMWMNSYESDVNVKLTDTVWNFGALDADSTITFDLSKVVSRLFYDVWFKEINFKSGTEITKCNNSSQNDTRYFRASTINIYEGATMHEIYVAPYRSFFECTTLNIYGGEIYNCYFSEYGMTIASTVNMFGGEIHDVYLYFTNTGVQEGIFNKVLFNMYGGEIYNNYIKASSTGAHSILAGTKHVIAGGLHDNYVFTSWPSLPTKDENGVYGIEGLDILSGVQAGNGVGATTVYDYSVIFKNADSSVISAYLVADGKLRSTVAGATEVTVPEGYSWALVGGGCALTTPSISTQGTYYVAKHTPENDDRDCTTALYCSVCGLVICEATEGHNSVVSCVYEDYFGNGTYSCDCTNEGCEIIDAYEIREALFMSKGISAKTFGDGIGLVQGYVLNKKAILSYKAVNADFDFGILAYANLEGVASMPKPGDDKVVDIVFENMANDYIDVKIVGIPDSFKDTPIVFCIYVTDNGSFYYLNDGVTTDSVVGNTYAEFLK